MRRLLLVLLVSIFILGAMSESSAKLPKAGKVALKEAEKLLKSKDTTNDVLVAALKKLAFYSDEDVTEWLVEDALPALINDPDRDPAYKQAVQTLLMMTDEDSQKYLSKKLFDRKKIPGVIRAEILRAKLSNGVDIDTLKQALADDAWEVQVRALIFMNTRGLTPKELLPELEQCLKCDNYRIKAATLPILERIARDNKGTATEHSIIEMLIDRVANDESKLKGDCIDRLKSYTGQDLGSDAEVWKLWLKRYKDGRTEKLEKKHGKTKVATYYGVKSYSKKMVYVIDCSISMEEPIDPEILKKAKKEITKNESETTGADGDKKNNNRKNQEQGLNWENIKSKFDLARAELKRSINALPEPDEEKRKKKGEGPAEQDCSFTIVAYAVEIKIWHEELVEATPRNKAEALDWIDKLATGSKTNIYGALDAAFRLAEGKKVDKPEDNSVKTDKDGSAKGAAIDTIFFLTDGWATTGKYFGGMNEIMRYDKNGDDKLSKDEFKAMFCQRFTQKEIDDSFANYDQNGDGFITISKKGATELSHGNKSTEIHRMQMSAMLDEIKERNEMLNIEINTVGIGNADSNMLGKLASYNKGKFINLGN